MRNYIKISLALEDVFVRHAHIPHMFTLYVPVVLFMWYTSMIFQKNLCEQRRTFPNFNPTLFPISFPMMVEELGGGASTSAEGTKGGDSRWWSPLKVKGQWNVGSRPNRVVCVWTLLEHLVISRTVRQETCEKDLVLPSRTAAAAGLNHFPLGMVPSIRTDSQQEEDLLKKDARTHGHIKYKSFYNIQILQMQPKESWHTDDETFSHLEGGGGGGGAWSEVPNIPDRRNFRHRIPEYLWAPRRPPTAMFTAQRGNEPPCLFTAAPDVWAERRHEETFKPLLIPANTAPAPASALRVDTKMSREPWRGLRGGLLWDCGADGVLNATAAGNTNQLLLYLCL